MRSSTDPDMKIDWSAFRSVDRRALQYKILKSQQEEFDSTNPGPYMLKWPMTNHNRHTKAMDFNLDISDVKAIISGKPLGAHDR